MAFTPASITTPPPPPPYMDLDLQAQKAFVDTLLHSESYIDGQFHQHETPGNSTM